MCTCPKSNTQRTCDTSTPPQDPPVALVVATADLMKVADKVAPISGFVTNL